MSTADHTDSDIVQVLGAAGVAVAEESLCCYLLVEIGNFADIRRTIGRVGSERLAEHASRRLSGALCTAVVTAIAHDRLVCRFRCSCSLNAASAPELIAAVFEEPFSINGCSLKMAPIVGSATYSASGIDEVDGIERAEAILAERRMQYRLTQQATEPLRRLPANSVARRLDRAIDRDQLVLHYQPKVHVRRQEIASAEALVRWHHPDRGLVMPNEFIPIAEECHLIGRMTLWTIRRAIADQVDLARCGHDLRLFINISGQLLADAAFVREVCDLIGASDAKLGFEITETSVIRDPQTSIANLQTFANFGITITIDDYGAGLSSLAYLKQLPARELKIDKMFVTQLTSSHRDPLIVRSTIDLAHALEMEVVAEGVETHAALALLTVMGCDMVQGFLISRPVPIDAFIRYLDEGQHRIAASPTAAPFPGLSGVRRRA